MKERMEANYEPCSMRILSRVGFCFEGFAIGSRVVCFFSFLPYFLFLCEILELLL